MDDVLPEPLPGASAREVVRATEDLAPIAEGVLHVMFPDATMFRSANGLVRLTLEPAPEQADFRRLKDKLFELVARPEWRAKHAFAREVTDGDGNRLEVMTPVAPAEYRGGPRLVGPFTDQRSAEEWGGDNAVSSLSFDTFYTGDAWLVDLFDLPDSDPHGLS